MRPARLTAALTAVLSLLAAVPAVAAPGDLDTGFADQGRSFDVNAHTASASLVTAMGTYTAGTNGTDLWVSRFDADGTRDMTFGGGDGLATLDYGTGTNASVTSLAMTDQGLAVGGSVFDGAPARRKMLVAWADPITGQQATVNGGYTIVDGADSSTVRAMAASGTKLLLVGSGEDSSNVPLAVAARLNNGVLDNTFSGDGVNAFGAAGYPDNVELNGVALLSDGSALVTGSAANGGGDVLLTGRLTTSGSETVNAYAVGAGASSGRALAVAGDLGYAAIEALADGRRATGVARITAAGALDPGFGSSGVVLAGIDDGHLQTAGVAVDGDRVYTAGGVISAPVWTVARFSTSGAVDAGFGGNGVARFAMGESAPSMARAVRVADDRVTAGGYASDTGTFGYAAVARLSATPSASAPAQPSGSGTSTTPAAGGGAEQPPAPSPETVAVRGLTFAVVASTEKRVRVLRLINFHFTSALQIERAAVPYVDIDWAFSASACAKDAQDGAIVDQTGDSGEMVVSPAQPALVHWKICLPTKEYAQFCSAKKIGGVIKKGRQDFDVFDDILGAMKQCKIDYDVKFTKQVDTPDLTKLKNTPAPKPQQKRKPIEAVVECSSNPAAQQFNAVWSEGIAVGASYGFHEPDPQIGYTIPAGQPSFVRLNATTKTNPMLPLEAKVLVDGDETGMPKMAPRTFRGEVVLRLVPARPGLIRACVVYEAANGVATATAAIRVVPEPRTGTVWRTAAGRQVEMTRNGPKLLTTFGGKKARAAWSLGELWTSIVTLFGGGNKQVNQIAATGQAPAQKAAAAGSAGISLGQLGNGGTLGTQPGLPVPGRGTVLTNVGGKLGATTGTVLEQNKAGTLIGAAGGNVVSAGGGNVVSAGGGNVVSAGGMNLISDNGLGLLSDNGLGLLSDNGLGLIGQASGNLIGQASGNLIGAATSNVVSPGGAN